MGTAPARHRRDDDWKPRFKARTKRRPSANSGSSRAADAAIANIRTIDRQLRRGVEVDREYLEKVARSLDPVGSERMRTAADTAPRSGGRSIVMGGLLGAVCLVVACCWSLVGSSAFTVAGKVFLDGEPLGDAELGFHPVAAAAADLGSEKVPEPFLVKVSRTGDFHVDSLPAGSYCITLWGKAEAGPVVPVAYGRPATTAFRLSLARDLPNIQLFASSTPSPRRPSAERP